MSLYSAALRNPSDAEAVMNFRRYLQIPSVHPDVDYDECVNFLENQATGLGLPMRTIYLAPNKPIVILTWVGNQPSLPSILLNSHMDVVPVYEDKWTHDPFSAHVDEELNIYGRGSQDMKCVGIQYLEVIRRLKDDNVTLRRTIHVSFVPDEETGGIHGMRKFVHTKEFKELNVGLVLDEGVASPNDEFVIFSGEKGIWEFKIHCPGPPGHGSLLTHNTAGDKVTSLLGKFYEFRRGEQQKLEDNPSLTIGDVTSINLTMVKGGVQANVIPDEFVLTFDCRIPPTENLEQFEAMLTQWCREAGAGVWIEYDVKDAQTPPTKLDESNVFWCAFKAAADSLGIKLVPQICPGATDARFVRGVGIPSFGFSPINNTPVLLHGHDEYLGVNTFVNGIRIYREIITSIANITDKCGKL